MRVESFTQIPNEVFDDYLPNLKLNELKVLLIVLRQTIGYHKEQDWISSSQMERKTGLSKRSISGAIDLLVKRNLITTSDDNGMRFYHPVERKGKTRVYFGSTLTPSAKRDITFRKLLPESSAIFADNKRLSY